MEPYFRPVADLHTHTLASPHAYSTLTENATAAAALGMVAIACTDHGPKTGDGMHPWHFSNMKILPDRIAGLRHLRGIEVNVCDFKGSLDLNEARLKDMEIVIASMHGGTMPYGTPEQITEAWLAVAENPLVDIIGHCGTPEFAAHYEAIIPAFGRGGKVVEINEGTFRVRRHSLENCARIAQLCKQYEVRVVVNSDAHYHEQVGQLGNAIALLAEAEFPQELIINSSRERFEEFLKEKQLVL